MSGSNPSEPESGQDGFDGQTSSESTRGDVGKPAEDSHTYSQAYSAPESEQVVSGPYVPVDPLLYDYDSYTSPVPREEEEPYARWPWVVGVTAIVAAVALVSSVALLVARTKTAELATPETTTSSAPPVQDEITTNKPPAPPPTSEEPPPPPPSEEPPPPPPPSEEEPPPPPPTSEEPPPPPLPAETAPPEPTTPPPTTTRSTPRQVTYSVSGTKAPFDQITITYIDASGQRRTQRNAYIPWSLTLTPISQSEIGSVEATSLLRLSKLNCSITSSDGTVLSSNSSDAPQTHC